MGVSPSQGAARSNVMIHQVVESNQRQIPLGRYSLNNVIRCGVLAPIAFVSCFNCLILNKSAVTSSPSILTISHYSGVITTVIMLSVHEIQSLSTLDRIKYSTTGNADF